MKGLIAEQLDHHKQPYFVFRCPDRPDMAQRKFGTLEECRRSIGPEFEITATRLLLKYWLKEGFSQHAYIANVACYEGQHEEARAMLFDELKREHGIYWVEENAAPAHPWHEQLTGYDLRYGLTAPNIPIGKVTFYRDRDFDQTS